MGLATPIAPELCLLPLIPPLALLSLVSRLRFSIHSICIFPLITKYV